MVFEQLIFVMYYKIVRRWSKTIKMVQIDIPGKAADDANRAKTPPLHNRPIYIEPSF